MKKIFISFILISLLFGTYLSCEDDLGDCSRCRCTTYDSDGNVLSVEIKENCTSSDLAGVSIGGDITVECECLD